MTGTMLPLIGWLLLLASGGPISQSGLPTSTMQSSGSDDAIGGILFLLPPIAALPLLFSQSDWLRLSSLLFTLLILIAASFGATFWDAGSFDVTDYPDLRLHAFVTCLTGGYLLILSVTLIEALRIRTGKRA